MTYEYGTLRPPTPREMAKRYVELETLDVRWIKDQHGFALEHSADPSVAELAAFIADNSIPMGAKLGFNGWEGSLTLDWTHLELCEVCELWAEPHDEADAFHAFKLSMMEPDGDPQAQVTA